MTDSKSKNLTQSVRKANQVINLDFSIPAHNAFFLELYGGLNNLKNNLPLFYQLYEKTLQSHKKGIGLDYKTLLQTGDEILNNFVDGIDIEYVDYTASDNKLYAVGVTSLKNYVDFIDQHMEIRTSAGEVVAGLSTSTSPTPPAPGISKASIEINTNFNPNMFKSNVLEIDYTCVWIDHNTGLLNAQITSEDHEEIYVNNIVKSITLNNPIKKTTGDPTKVVVCYDRSPQVGEIVDYIYQQALITIDGKQYQQLILEFGASVKFYENTAAFKNIVPSSFILRLTSERGMAKYSTTERMDEIMRRFTKTTDGFAFNLNSDWKDTVPTARLPVHDLVDIHMEVNFNLQDGYIGSITISSLVPSNKPSANIYKALPLNLLWGCLSKDTIVTMADGSEKLITEVKIGDRLLSNNCKIAIVTNKWKGNENSPLLCIVTEKNHKIKCSNTHPILTKNGVKTADSLNGSDLLIDKYGEFVSIISLYPVVEKEVYNLDLSPEEGNNSNQGMSMICNGLLVGDNIMQNNIKNLIKEEIRINIYSNECIIKNNFFAEKGVNND